MRPIGPTLARASVGLAVLLSTALAAGAQAPPAPAPVTLEEALARARTGNALLQAARADVKAKEGQNRLARSFFMPNLTFTENFSRTDNPVYVFMGKLTQADFGMQDFYIPSLNYPAPLNNWQSRLEMTLPLFTGGKIKAAYEASKLGVEAAQSTADFAETSVVKGVTEAFYGSLLARQAVGTLKEAVKTADAHLTQVEAMHKEGLVLDSDLLRMRVFAADMAQQEAAREADEQVARSYLAYAMGTQDEVAPAGDLAPPSGDLPALEEAEKEALDRRGDLKAVALQAEQALRGVTMAKADYWPQVGAMAAYEHDTDAWNSNIWGENWMVGVQLKLALFDGGGRAGRLDTARAQEAQVRQALMDAQQRVRVDVKSAWLRARAAAQRVAVTTESEAQAKENQRIVALRYQEGMASITDLLDADTALTAASLVRSQAIHDELVERARLSWAMGK